MFRIGDFSKIANVPITQLRYYNDIGVFKPAHTDAITGYRHYSIEQMPRLNRILALRDLGMSLEQIKYMLDDNVSAEEIRGMFTLRKAQIEKAIRDDLDRLKAVEYRLSQIEQEDSLGDYDVVLKELPEQPMFSRRTILNEWQWAITLFNDISHALDIRNSRFKGTHSSLIHAVPEKDGDGYDVEIGYIGDESLNEEIAEQFDMTLHTLDKAEVATLLHQGGSTDVNGYLVVANWVERNNYKLTGAIRELYWNLPKSFESADLVIEFQFPVVRCDTNSIHNQFIGD